MREELGVNAFTAPSIQTLLDELNTLRPIRFKGEWEKLPDTSTGDRSRLALRAGQVIADGMVAVAAEKQSRLEPVGRALLRVAKGLGVGEHVTRHSRSIVELSARGSWREVRRELIKAQAEVEAGMLALKDDELAHFVSLGGWMRGLEVASSVVLDDFTPERAARLVQPRLVEYFLDRLATVHPDTRKTALITRLEGDLKTLQKLSGKPAESPLTAAVVGQMHDLARSLNRAIRGEEE